MTAFLDAKTAIAVQLGAIGDTAQLLAEPLLAQACRAELERLEAGRLEVVVCGEFKVGKSMLVNAMLDLPGLVPVDFDIATSAIIMIGAGETLRAFVASADGTAPPREIDPANIEQWASESQRSASEDATRMILVEAPSPFLQDGLTLVDTPGIGGLSRTHSEITFAELAKADLVLFVTEAQRPLTTHELSFIENRILPLNSSLALVLSKSDLQPDLADIHRANRDKLAPLFAEAAFPPVFLVSSRLKLDYRRSGDPQDLAESGHPALEQYVSSVMKATGQTRILTRAAAAIGSTAEKMIEPRRTELIALRGEGSPGFKAMKQEIDGARQAATRLRHGRGEWRNRLFFEISEMRTKIVDQGLTRSLIELETAFLAKANASSGIGDELQAVARELEQDLQVIYLQACQSIAEATDVIRTKLATDTGIPLSSIVRDPDAPIQSAPLLDTQKTKGWTSRIGDWANQWRRQVAGGATLGAFTGGLIGAAVGFLAGGAGAIPGFIAGFYLGAGGGALIGVGTGIPAANKHLKSQKAARARDVLVSQLGPYLRLANRQIADNCLDLVGRLKQGLAREFELRIDDAEADLAAREAALARGLAAEADAIAARTSALSAEIALLDGYQVRADAAIAAFASTEA